MRRLDNHRVKWLTAVFFFTASLIVATDQLSKLWIRSYSEGQLIFKAWFFSIIRVHNTGASFGLFQDQSLLLTIVAFIGIALIFLFVLLIPRTFPLLDTKLGRLALGLILGGTIGNLVDRLHLGYVTDFIDIGLWPTFNVADSALTIGCILFAYSLLSSTRAPKTFLT